ncbi:hypothetical protein C8R43DRAFT_523757 [Mycena crocata]|nr:hypothetical protein C8R43DRAFT_523757 [Mycena crocata]
MSDSGESSYSSAKLQSGRACWNCRRRKIKCDGIRPTCGPCRMRPPRSGDACVYKADDPPGHQTPSEMQETIKSLRARVRDLERVTGHTASSVPLHGPYDSASYNSSPSSHSQRTTPDADDGYNNFQEPAPDVIAKLVDTFLDRFSNSGHFFLEPLRFCSSALLARPFGDRNRPAPCLLSAVYLWGSILSSTTPNESPAEDAFLLSTLQNISADIRAFSVHPRLVLDTIQAEVLLSLYYLHAALPVQGRYHAAAAASLAFTAGLQHLNVTPGSPPRPSFPLAEHLLPRETGVIDVAERIDAFWAVVTVNSYWAAAEGSPSAIPYSANIDTPWPSGAQAGATITKFLNGNDADGHSAVALVTKTSILLERIVSFSARNAGFDRTAFNSLNKRLQTFQATLPIFAGDRTLFMVHALTDTAIIRLHMPHASSSSTARYETLAAAGRISANLTHTHFVENFVADPMLGPLCANVSAVFMSALTALRSGTGTPQERNQYQEIQGQLNTVVNAMTLLRHKSPVMQRCLASISM